MIVSDVSHLGFKELTVVGGKFSRVTTGLSQKLKLEKLQKYEGSISS